MARQMESIEIPNEDGKLLVEGRRKSQTVSVTGTAPFVASLKERFSMEP